MTPSLIFLCELGRTTLYLAVLAAAAAIVLRTLRISSPAAHRAACLLALAAGWSFLRIPITVPWHPAPNDIESVHITTVSEVDREHGNFDGEHGQIVVRALRAPEIEIGAESSITPQPTTANNVPLAVGVFAKPPSEITSLVESGAIPTEASDDAIHPAPTIAANEPETSEVAMPSRFDVSRIANVLLSVWVAGIAAIIVAWLLGYIRFIRRLPVAEAGDAAWDTEWQALLRVCGIRSPIPLRVTAVAGPMLCRLPRGYELLVPAPLWRELSANERQCILQHELAHFERADVWKSLAIRFLALPHWFNPAAWLAVRRFDEAAEWACDLRAASDNSPAAYARALLRLGEATGRRTAYSPAARTRPLAARIRRLLKSGVGNDSRTKKLLLAGVLGLLAITAMVRVELVAQEPAAEEVRPGSTAVSGAAVPTKIAETADSFAAPLVEVGDPNANDVSHSRENSQKKTQQSAKKQSHVAVITAAREAYDGTLKAYESGRTSLDTVNQWSARLMKAEESAAADTVGRRAAVQGHIDRMRALQQSVQAKFDVAAAGGEADKLAAANYYVAEAEELTAGLSPPGTSDNSTDSSISPNQTSSESKPTPASSAAAAKDTTAEGIAVAYLQVKRNPEMIAQVAKTDYDFNTLRATVIEMMKSNFVLARALRDPTIGQLPVVKQQKDAVDWLQGSLQLRYPSDGEILEVKLSGKNPEQLAKIVNAVIAAYFKEVVESDRQDKARKEDQLKRLHQEKEDALRNELQLFKQVQSAVGALDAEAAARRISLLTMDLQSANSLITGLTGQMMNIDTEVEQYKLELELAQDTTANDARLEEEYRKDERLKKLEEDLGKLELGIAEMRQSLENKSSSALERAMKTKASYEKQIAERREEVSKRFTDANQQLKVKEFKGKLANSEKHKNRIEEQLDKQKKRAQQLTDDLTKITSNSTDLEAKKHTIHALESEIADLKRELYRMWIEHHSPARIRLLEEATVIAIDAEVPPQSAQATQTAIVRKEMQLKKLRQQKTDALRNELQLLRQIQSAVGVLSPEAAAQRTQLLTMELQSTNQRIASLTSQLSSAEADVARLSVELELAQDASAKDARQEKEFRNDDVVRHLESLLAGLTLQVAQYKAISEDPETPNDELKALIKQQTGYEQQIAVRRDELAKRFSDTIEILKIKEIKGNLAAAERLVKRTEELLDKQQQRVQKLVEDMVAITSNSTDLEIKRVHIRTIEEELGDIDRELRKIMFEKLDAPETPAESAPTGRPR